MQCHLSKESLEEIGRDYQCPNFLGKTFRENLAKIADFGVIKPLYLPPGVTNPHQNILLCNTTVYNIFIEYMKKILTV